MPISPVHFRAMIRVAGSIAAAAGLVLLLFGSSGQAIASSSFTVTTVVDAVDIDPGDGVCATFTGDCSLRAAIQEGNESTGPTTIDLPVGHYVFSLGGSDEDGSNTGDLDVHGNLVLKGSGASISVVDASGLDRVFHVHEGGSLQLKSLSVENGRAPVGGGVFSAGNLVIEDSSLTHNQAIDSSDSWAHGGGAVFSKGSLSVDATSFLQNTAYNGGAILINDSDASIRTSEFVENEAHGTGGAITITRVTGISGTLSIADSQILDNRSRGDGGGIRTTGSYLVVAKSSISGNTSSLGGGGGIDVHNDTSQDVRITDSTFSGNSAFDYGGGLFIGNAITDIHNSTFSGNIASSGGGIFNSGVLSFVNGTITDNTARDIPVFTIGGGGVANAAPESLSPTNLLNSIVAGNWHSSSPNLDGEFTSLGHNLIGANDGSTGFVDGIGNDIVGASASPVNPLLGPLANNGGPTQTHVLLPGSPAIDAGDSSVLATPFSLAFDQRGLGRQAGTSVDIGAVEVTETEATPAMDISDFLTPVGYKSQRDHTPQEDAPYGLYTIIGTGRNDSAKSFDNLFVVVTSLSGNNQVLNCDQGVPMGVGCVISIPEEALNSDGILSPGEEFSHFGILGVFELGMFTFEFEVWGRPVGDDGAVTLRGANIPIALSRPRQSGEVKAYGGIPEVAASASQFMAVWGDSRNHEDNRFDSAGARIDVNGDVLDLDGITIAGTPLSEGISAVGSDGSGFLVAWSRNDAPGQHDIYASRVSSAGEVLDDPPMRLSFSGKAGTPAVAFDGTNYLVVYRDSRNLPDGGIFGRLVSPSGTVIGSEITVTKGQGNRNQPAVASNGTNFLVVWDDGRNADGDIYGTRIGGDGAVLDPAGVPIAQLPSLQIAADVASNGQDYMVVWEDFRGGGSAPMDIYGARVTGGGDVVDTTPIPLAVLDERQVEPAVASNGLDYAVVWEDWRNGTDGGRGKDIFATVIDFDGNVLMANGTSISNALSYRGDPQLAALGDQYLAVWEDLRGGDTASTEIYGQIFSTDTLE